MKRKMLAVSALAAVPLVQLTVVNGLALPGGGTPDLVLLCVVALGLTGGPAPGLIAGFCAGLALDLAPPASQIVGQYALVLCLVGYGSGRLRFTLRHSAAAAIAAAAVMAALGGDSRAAACGRWLVGDVAEAAPTVGAIGWLAGPVRSRRARREQARLTAMATGASQRRGAFWVGRRPPGLVPVMPPAPARPGRLVRLRPGSGVPGTAATPARPAPQLLRRPVRLGLADEQRRRSRPAGRAARGHGRALPGREQHGVDAHGVNGPSLPSIRFATGILPGTGRTAGRDVPRIAFGTGSLPGGGPAAGHRAAAAGATASRRVPRIAFGALSAAPAERSRASRAGAARPGARGVRPATPRFASGPRLAGSAGARAGLGSPAGQGGPMASCGTRREGVSAGRHPGRKVKQPGFARSAGGHQVARTRQPKSARMSAGRRSFRRLPWLRRSGDRSTVWRIGNRRTGGFR